MPIHPFKLGFGHISFWKVDFIGGLIFFGEVLALESMLI